MFNRLLPQYRLPANDPVFALEARRLPGGGDMRALLRQSLRWMLWIFAGVIGLLLGWLVLNAGEAGYPFWFQATVGGYIGMLLLLGVLGSPILDASALAASVNSISGDVTSGRWDILRLTPLRETRLLAAKHAAAQLRTWRSLVRVVAVRIAALLLGLWLWVVDALANPYFALFTGPDSLIDLFLIIVFIGLAALYLIEPFWRLRAMTALGLFISTRVRDNSGAALAAVGVVFGLWIAQIGILFVLMMTTSFALLICPPVFIVIFGAAIYGFFSTINAISLRRAALRLARLE